MPKIGFLLAMRSRITGTAYCPVAAGSPGPFERKIPSGSWRRIASALASAGTTVMARRLEPAIAGALHPTRLVPAIALAARDFLGEVHAFEPRPGPRLRQQRRDIESAIKRIGDRGVGRAAVADSAGEAAGIDAGKP